MDKKQGNNNKTSLISQLGLDACLLQASEFSAWSLLDAAFQANRLEKRYGSYSSSVPSPSTPSHTSLLVQKSLRGIPLLPDALC